MDSAMKNYLTAILLVACASAQASTITVDPMRTVWQAGAGPQSNHVQSQDTFFFDLSDRTGLVADQPIRVVLSFGTGAGSASAYWSGGNVVGNSSLHLIGSLSVAIGAQAQLFSLNTTLTIGAYTPDPGATPAVYVTEDSLYLPSFEFVVPWDTDLSSVSITLSQDSRYTNGLFRYSTLFLPAGQFELTSVPEPQGFIWLVLVGLLKRSRVRGNGVG
jgi:hypothetical protein